MDIKEEEIGKKKEMVKKNYDKKIQEQANQSSLGRGFSASSPLPITH